MKQKKLLLYITGLLLVFSSCEKSFLDIKPSQSVSIADAIVSVPTMRTALTGVYSLMQSSDYYGRNLVVLPDLMADNMYQSVIAGARYTNYDRYNISSNDGDASSSWIRMYQVVTNANVIIEKGAALQAGFPLADAAEGQQIRGEAYAIRALAFFDLCKLFAKTYTTTTDASHLGIPLVLSYPKDKNDISFPARNTVKESYDQMIKDLDSAISLLPASGNVINGVNTSRINKWAAYALQSRVYLYKGDWANAETAASQVINSNKYSLLPNTTLIADYKKQLNAESLLEVVNNDKDNAGTDGVAYIYSQAGYGEMLCSTNLYGIYSSSDMRRSFITKGNRNASGGETNVNLINKYSGNTVNFNENIKIIRLAEMYLNRAEARARIGVNLIGAQADVQAVRLRAQPTATPVTETGTALIDLIINERRKEFAFEGFRLYDLLRTKTSFIKYSTAGNTISVSWNSNKVTLPIPQREITINNHLEQNSGY
jgi:hypothetical protein